MFEKAIEDIREYDTIILHRHVRPDGDALGSQIGLKHLILENFPGKRVFMTGDPAKRYSFMEDSTMDRVEDADYASALAVVLDTPEKSMVSDDRFTKAKRTLRFDHHLFTKKFCDEEYVDPTFESCCGLITFFAMKCCLKVSPWTAKLLYTGIVTDTGRFRYASTNAMTMKMASFL